MNIIIIIIAVLITSRNVVITSTSITMQLRKQDTRERLLINVLLTYPNSDFQVNVPKS